MSNKKITTDVSERPINNASEDCFDADPRLANKIHNFIQFSCPAQLTIAIAGEWGVGKSSVINLLRAKLEREKNIIINFDPLLEGKLELADIMGLFYFKLHQSLKGNSYVKEVIQKCFKSAAILSRSKITANASLDGSVVGICGSKVGVQVEYNLEKNIDDLFKLWDKKELNQFSDQVKELNKSLRRNEFKLYIFIDEIDRLPSAYIIQLLIFCRILEEFDNLVCIVGIDYEQVLRKLINEGELGLGNYNHAQCYLDKLFQIKFNVSHNKYQKIEYGKNKLRELDSQNILSDVINPLGDNIELPLEEIFDYLSTPRQIKKWLISLAANYAILKHSRDKIGFMAFLAVIVKHPVVADYMSKYLLEMLKIQGSLVNWASETYGIQFSPAGGDIDIQIMATSLGVMSGLKGSNHNANNFEKLAEKLGIQSIEDIVARKYLLCYLGSSPYLISLFIEGFIDEEQVELYENFFSGNVNRVIESMISDGGNIHMLASELATTLQKGYERMQVLPDISLLNKLWQVKVSDDSFLGNPYQQIILSSLQKFSIEKIISESSIAISEHYTSHLLSLFNIKNQNGIYDINHYKQPASQEIERNNLKDIKYKGIDISNFTKDKIVEIVEGWLERVEIDLGCGKTTVYSQPLLIKVFYRYVQWGHALRKDNREKLARFVIKYLNEATVKNNKESVKKIIRTEKAKFDGQRIKIGKDPMEELFNNNGELNGLISD